MYCSEKGNVACGLEEFIKCLFYDVTEDTLSIAFHVRYLLVLSAEVYINYYCSEKGNVACLFCHDGEDTLSIAFHVRYLLVLSAEVYINYSR